MDRRHPLKLLGTTAAFAGWTPVELEALLTPGGGRRAGMAFFTDAQREANQIPNITYMALTARAANHAVDLIDRGEL